MITISETEFDNTLVTDLVVVSINGEEDVWDREDAIRAIIFLMSLFGIDSKEL